LICGFLPLFEKKFSTNESLFPVTKPYNADFDGDEMNMHCPQSWAARAELKEIMHVNEQIISPQGNRPVIGAVQDTVSGAFIMTWKDTFFTREEFQQLMIEVHYADDFPMPPPAIVHPCERWTGKQIASYLLPKKLYFSRVVRNGNGFDPMDSKERTVVVQGGQLLCGSLCKKTIGTSELGFVHLICQDISNQRANQFLSDISRCVASFFRDYGFSIGLGDCVTSEETQHKIHETLESIFQSVQDLDDPTDEKKVFPLLQKALEKTGKIVMNSLDKTNNIYNCVTSGAKGSNLNLGQIMGCVGQQAINGGRIAPNPRTLPSFDELDRDPNAKGFVANSYLLGLQAEEFFFHMMGGREGMIDTAVKTASTGYIQRKLTKFLESLVVLQDNSVRDSVGNLMGLIYGGDGYNARYLETVKLPVLLLSVAEIQAKYRFDASTLARVVEMRDALLKMRLNGMHTIDCKYRLPVNIARLIQIEDADFDMWAPADMFATWEDIQAFETSLGNDWPMRLHLLCSCALALKRGDSIPGSIFDLIRYRMGRANVAPGEAVGPIASTSIGEPTTQVSFVFLVCFSFSDHSLTVFLFR
jgi:DNA-directed RNA polymerase II subunit RPB1